MIFFINISEKRLHSFLFPAFPSIIYKYPRSNAFPATLLYSTIISFYPPLLNLTAKNNGAIIHLAKWLNTGGFMQAIIPILIAFVLPIGLLIYFMLKKREYLKSYLIGILTFFIFQIILRMPLLNLLITIPTIQNILSNIWIYAIFLGFSAGLFEEFGRLIMMKFTMPKQITIKAAITFGLGHWACEAFLLVGLNYFISAINSPLLLPPFELATMAGLERLFTLPVHVGMSILVMKSLIDHTPKGFLLALLGHTIIDSLLIPMQNVWGFSLIQIELYIFIWAVVLSYYIYYSLKKDEKNDYAKIN